MATEPVTGAAEPIVSGLREAQREAVLHGSGPLLIIAGAGTGKTTVLTRRIAHLITSKAARPEEILALTFTEKAAVEMAERVDQLIPYGYAETFIATFHAFGDRVLRDTALEAGLDPDFRVLTRPEQVIFLSERLFELPLYRYRPLGDPTRHLSNLLDVVSRAKDEDVWPREYRAWAEGLAATATTPEGIDEAERQLEIAAFYETYQQLMARAGLADFGDQIFGALQALRSRPQALAKLRQRYRHVLVDEFQDTNHAQLELLRLVAGEGAPNVTVVGDDDQAIYRWRGAASANLLAFRQLYPGCREVVLRDNYRSTQEILDASRRLVRYNNPQRLEVVAGIDKALRAERGHGAPVRHQHFDSLSAEADGVAAGIADRIQSGFRPRDFAILVRSNADADPFLRALNVREIPHRFSGSRGLYAREEVRLAVAFLRSLAQPEDSVSVFYLAASDMFGADEADLLRLNSHAQRKRQPLLDVFRHLERDATLVSVGGKTRTAVKRLIELHERAAAELPRKRTGEVLYGFLLASGYLGELSRAASPTAEAKIKNLSRFFDVVKAYGDVAEHDRVPDFVSHLTLLRDAGSDPAVAEADQDEDAVHVMTVHAAKGLEFPVVFLVNAVDQKFPLRNRSENLALPDALLKDAFDTGDAHMQEERRLFHVAMTRAKDELIITSSADHGGARQRKISRFVVEALDLPTVKAAPRRSSAIEALRRNQPVGEELLPQPPPVDDDEVVRLSNRQLDDYETCPLKYRYIHILRVPLLSHHRIAYGNAVHRALEHFFRERLAGRELGAEGLVAAFRGAWVAEGFLSREHEEERLRAGEAALRRFHANDALAPLRPTAVEKEFTFYVDSTRVNGRYDLLVARGERTDVLDFKTGDVDDLKKAQERVKDSLQLDVYALAHLRTEGRLPDWVELRFVEQGLAAGRKPTLEDVQETEARIRTVAARIRHRDFPATPSWRACSGCPFREICPHTTSGNETA
jgi:DNA helicase-2/ATP-dependent DNA helicase PcrA